jgi:Leucine-rich repeat (LRR) protein
MSLSNDLPHSSQPSQEVVEFIQKRKKLREIPKQVLTAIHLQKIDFSHNLLKALPEELSQFQNLQYLNLGNNQFGEFPSVLFQLNSLKYIDLRYNKLHEIPIHIEKLQSLETLNLRANYIHELPKEIGQLPKLEKIILRQNMSLDLEQVTESLSQISHLFELDLSACHIEQLPSNFTKLQNLRSLYLSENPKLDLEDTFEKLAHLPNLENLNLEDTKERLPENLANLQNLRSLTYNYLSADAKHVAQLKNLRELEAKKSSLGYIPEWLFEMPQLHVLNLSDNQISQIPDSFKNLKNLKKLDFRNNSFTKIPPLLSKQLAQFEELYLDGNQNIPYKKLNKFLKLCRERKLNSSQKELACQLWNGHLPEASWSLEICLLLLQMNLPILSKNTLAWLDQHHSTQKDTLLSAQKIALIGNSLRYTQNEAKKFLEQKGLKVYTKAPFPEDIDGWIIGEKIRQNTQIPPNQPALIWTDAHLHEYLLKENPLPDLPYSQIKKINDLLIHSSSQNQNLGLQMLQPYQFPNMLKEVICVIYLFHKDKKLKQMARALVKKYFSNHLQAEMLKLEEIEPEISLKTLIKKNFLDLKRLVNVAYLVAKIGEKYVIEQGGIAFKSLIEDKVNYRHILSLKLNIENISPELKDLDYIQKIEIIGSVFHKIEMKQIPDVLYEMPQLTYLRIDDANLSEIDNKIGSLNQLTKLRLANCKLSHLPENIGQLTHLETLSLFNNHLKHIPAEIGKLSHLKELWLFSNQLKDLPEEIGDLIYLERLHLSANQLKTLPATIGKLQNLQELSISGNPLESLPEEITQLKNLKRMEIRRNTLLSKDFRDWLQLHLPDCSIQFHY